MFPIKEKTKLAGKPQSKSTTIDLNQAAGTYDLFTATDTACLVTELAIRLPNIDCSDDSGGFTGISIQTDDGTPAVFISQAEGVKANLTAESQLAWTGLILVANGSKIQLTIYGAATDATTNCAVATRYSANNDGGYLS